MAKRKINIDEIGLDKRYFPIYDSHNLYSEGFGRKVHIIDTDTGKCLCGYETPFYSAVDYQRQFGDIIKYIAQPDPDGDICKSCKRIMINALEVKED